MIRRRYNRNQYIKRISHPDKNIKQRPESTFSNLPDFEIPAKDPGMVDHGDADAEGISEVHRGHGGEGIHVVSLHPHRLGVVAADAVEESVLRGEKTRRHAWVEDKDAEGEEVG